VKRNTTLQSVFCPHVVDIKDYQISERKNIFVNPLHFSGAETKNI
jgi:hypothetical protein